MNDEQLAAILAALEQNSMEFGNFNSNNRVMGNYNAGMNNYNAGMNAGNFNQGAPVTGRWAQSKQVSTYPSNFQMRLVWKANPSPGPGYEAAPVDVLLFQSAYVISNGGVFLSNGNLQFTNAGGDTATISMIGRNAGTVEEFYNILETEPAELGWTRMFVQAEAQKSFGMVFSDRSQYGSKTENDLSPNIYDNQYTYRPLIQDVPLNFLTSKKKGILWTVGTTETNPGTTMVFFVDSVMSPDHAMRDQAMVQQLGQGTQFSAPAQPLINGGGGLGSTNPQAAQMMQNFLIAKKNFGRG